jgi:WD40 repeat protein
MPVDLDPPYKKDKEHFFPGDQVMSSVKILTSVGVAGVAATLIWIIGLSHSPAQSDSPQENKPTLQEKTRPDLKNLVAQAPRKQARPDPNQPAAEFQQDAIVIPKCQLTVDEKTELSTLREGILLFVGRPLKENEVVPPDHADTYLFKGVRHPYRRLKRGDIVQLNEVLGQIDNRMALDELNNKAAKLEAAKADLVVSEKTRDEAEARYRTQQMLFRKNATSQEELRAAELAWVKYKYEVVQKGEAIKVAAADWQQTKTLVELHEIRSTIEGKVEQIYKSKGEQVKNLEPILVIRNLNRLRAEGQVDIQYLSQLNRGMNVWVERDHDQPHYRPFVGHLEPITGVAVSKNSNSIVSVSEDHTVRAWPLSGHERVWDAGVGLTAVACTPNGSASNYCAVGTTDGTVLLYDLDGDSDKPLRVFDKDSKHRRKVNCVAFNKDGTICASGSVDREIHIWDVASGQLKQKLTDHKGPVTCVQFTPQDQLVSVGEDKAILIWNLGPEAKSPAKIPTRSGDVPILGVSPDGKRVLYDPHQSKVLRILSLPNRQNEGIIRNPSGEDGFKTLALFSPDGRFVLTGSEGRLQLWATPTENTRACEVRSLTLADPSSITCAAFSPDGKFVVAGTKDRQVVAWGHLPSEKEVADFRIPAVISNVGKSVEGGSRKVRIEVEFKNPEGPDGHGLLMPGGIVTIVVPPAKSVVQK